MTLATPIAVGSPDTRTIHLPGGQRLVVRPVSAADIADLADLHATLRSDDRHRHCATIARSGPDAAGRMVTAGDRGGFGLAATVSESRHHDDRLIGAVSYELLANGDGELSIVVASGWRWWLQRLLLHQILEAAHRRAVPNLEVDVPLTNQELLGFARARGCAFTRSERQWSVRCVIGTRGRTPTWPGAHDRPRVLIETPAGSWRADPAFAHPDWQVLVCPGPDDRDCPTLDGQVCPLAAAADAIVVAPRPGDRHWSALSVAHRPLHPGVPVFVRAPTPVGAPHGDATPHPSPDHAVIDRTVVDRAARTHAHHADDWTG